MKRLSIVTLLVLASCTPEGGGDIPLIPVESSPQTSSKKPDSIPPLPDPKVSISIPSTSTLPDEALASQIPLISQEVPTKENEISPPALTNLSSGNPLLDEVTNSQTNPTDLSTQISVPLSVPLPQTTSVSPEIALQINASVQEVSPSTSTSISTSTSTSTSTSISTSTSVQSVATFVGAVQESNPSLLQEDPLYTSEITSDIADKELNVSRCASYSLTLDTSDGIWYTTPTNGTISGIETYWANQNLWANFKGICKRGYYRVQFQAKNTKGTLPSSYTKFEVSTINKSLPFGWKNKKTVGLAEITASTNDYRQGSTRVWLEPGENKILIQWRNDYNTDGHDSNIQIKKIWLEPVLTTEVADLNRNGVQFCNLQSNGNEWKWYWKDDYIHTFWSDSFASFCFPEKRSRYKVLLAVRSFGGTLPPSGYAWSFKVLSEGNETTIIIPASKDFKTGYSFLQTSGKEIKILWLNQSIQNLYPQIRNITIEESP